MILHLPEPPSLNQMIRWRGARWGAYSGHQQKYMESARLMLPEKPQDAPWERWAIVDVQWRLWSLRDPLELSAGLKWPVDLLEEEGWVAGDAPDQLVWIDPEPTQEIERATRGVTLEIEHWGGR